MTELPKIDLVCIYQVIAGHELKRLDWTPDKNKSVFGKCAGPHGHDYKIELFLTGTIDAETGLVINGYDVDAIVQPFLDQNVDHKFLNTDIAFFKMHQPTAEWIAVWIFTELAPRFPKHVTLKKVRVFETQNLAAEYPVVG